MVLGAAPAAAMTTVARRERENQHDFLFHVALQTFWTLCPRRTATLSRRKGRILGDRTLGR